MQISNDGPLALNPDARWHVLKIGHEQTRVLLVDDLFTHLRAVQQLAAQQTFTPEAATYYPGVRARCPDVLRDIMLSAAASMMISAYGLPQNTHFSDQGCWLSLAATPEKALHPLQCLPHFDSQLPTDFAIMLYASNHSFSGTGFYRHLPTGFENITQARWPAFERARKDWANRTTERPQSYFNHSTNEYQRLGTIDYKPNRMVVYPGTLLHSGLINPDKDLSESPDDGRLTANVFVSGEWHSR
tara:strand:- start:1835 stop:2566 length:732 start_codon:yes stop_codon:yes gene_type:complete